jgi:hypothetical protein
MRYYSPADIKTSVKFFPLSVSSPEPRPVEGEPFTNSPRKILWLTYSDQYPEKRNLQVTPAKSQFAASSSVSKGSSSMRERSQPNTALARRKGGRGFCRVWRITAANS